MSGYIPLNLRPLSTYQRDEMDDIKSRVLKLETKELPAIISFSIIKAKNSTGLQLQDDGGNLGIHILDGGRTMFNTSTSLTGVGGTGQVEIDRDQNGQVLLVQTSANSGGPSLEFLKRRSGFNVVSDNDILGIIYFSAADGTNAAMGAKIDVRVDGTPGNDDMPTRMIFYTTPDGQQSSAEAFRINSLQNIIVANGKRIETDEVRARDSSGLSLFENGGLGIIINDSTGHIVASNNVRLEIDEVRARDSGGLALYDDGGNGLFVEDGGFVAIGGLTNPVAPLHVQRTAATGGEEIARFTVSDDAVAFIRIVNSTSADGVFVPALDTLSGGAVASRIDISKITDDSGSTPAYILDARTNAGAAISTRPLFDYRTFGTSKMLIFSTLVQFGAGVVVAAETLRARGASGLEITDDGGNLAILVEDGGQVGVGGVTNPNAALSVKAGTSTDHANVGGVIYVTTATTGNVGTGQDTIASYSVPANTLATNGDSLWFEASGTFGSTSNNRRIRVIFGGTGVVETNTLSIAAAGTWALRGRIFRTGAATQRGWGAFWTEGDQYPVATMTENTAPAETLSGAVTLAVTGEATANNDIVCNCFIVGWEPNNT